MENEPAKPRILVVEDEAVVAFDIKAILTQAGAEVIGPAATLADALRLSDHDGLCGAILDVRLGEDAAWPVAEYLAEKGIPFLFHTSYADMAIEQSAWAGKKILHKPATSRDVVKALQHLVNRA